jgi:hypothetical protein
MIMLSAPISQSRVLRFSFSVGRMSECRRIKLRRTIACIGCLIVLYVVPPHDARAVLSRTEKLKAIIDGIRESHNRLLRYPGGIAIRYRLDFKEDPGKRSHFAFKRGLNGSLHVRWPELYCRVEGVMSVQIRKQGQFVPSTTPIIREGSFNFETFSGVARDGDFLGQIVNHRDSFSANSGLPLRYQFFAEMDLYYEPGKDYKTDYWLPQALEQYDYFIGGDKLINGIPCRILHRQGMDTMWLSLSHGYMICQREFHYGVGKPIRERIQNTDLKEIAPGLWFPMTQIKEEFDTSGGHQATYTLRVSDLQLGKVTDSDVRLVLPASVQYIEDHITGKTYRPSHGSDVDQFDAAMQRARESNPTLVSTPFRRRVTILLLNVSAILVIAIFWQRRHAKSSQLSSSKSEDPAP